ncbi:MAG: nucleotidyltransferase family protein [Rhodospirillales bacterium]
MNDWHQARIDGRVTVAEAIRVIDRSGFQIALVTDKDDRLMGTITDGDVRRAILRGTTLESMASKIMNKSPVTMNITSSNEERLSFMNERQIRQIPIVNDHRAVVDLVHINDLMKAPKSMPNQVILMAGGLGTRLTPLTQQTPKPLLPVGGRPILDTIINRLKKQGFRKFVISINYKADVFIEHFKNPKFEDLDIDFLHELEPLGTAGALNLLDPLPALPFIVMNGDLLTSINFNELLRFHNAQSADATMGVREYDFQVPFGVVDIEGAVVKSIIEKPVHRFFVNAGIYVISPKILEQMPSAGPIDMTALLQHATNAGQSVAAFPMHEHWLDIGNPEDLAQAQREIVLEND